MKKFFLAVMIFASTQAFSAEVDLELQKLADGREASLAPDELDRFEHLLADGSLLAAKRIDPATLSAIGTLLTLSSADDAFQQKQTDDLSDLWSRVGIDVDPFGFSYLVDTIEQSHERPPIFGGAPKIEANKVVRPTQFVDTARDRVGLPPVDPYYDLIDRRLAKGVDPVAILKRPLAARTPIYPTDWVLRSQLVRLARNDQSVRDGKIDEKRMHDVDAADHAELLRIIQSQGFPDSSKVGRFGLAAIWLVVQHQIQDPALMKRFRDYAKGAMERGELARASYALLDDRIRCYIDGNLELYGTQAVGADEHGMLVPVADPEHVNARRASMRIMPMNLKNARGECKEMAASFKAAPPTH